MALDQPTPLRLAQLTMIGAAILATGCFLALLPLPRATYKHGLGTFFWSERRALLLVFAPVLAGIAITLRYNARLGKGLIEGRWTELEIDQARRWIDRPALRNVQIAFLILLLVFYTFSILGNHHGGTLIFTYFFINPYSLLQTKLRKPRDSKPLIDWPNVQPLRSTHWGQQS